VGSVSAEQLSLSVEPRVLARATDVETSHAAAAANRGLKASHRRDCLVQHDRFGRTGLIDDEVSVFTGLSEHETGRRCSDLRRLGLIEWLEVDGKPVTRMTRLERQARVSIITPAGREALR
jgi:hypothetical protein